MANKKRLIDAKAGKKLFCAIAKPAEYNGVIHLVVPISEIDKLPTVDAVEVVHGRWEILGKAVIDTIGKCTSCGGEAIWRSRNSPYATCPNCGAKMDGGEPNAQ